MQNSSFTDEIALVKSYRTIISLLNKEILAELDKDNIKVYNLNKLEFSKIPF